MTRILARYTRQLPVSDPERGPHMVQTEVIMVWCSERYRYELWQYGNMVPEFPHSIYPPKLDKFLTAIGYQRQGELKWFGQAVHHGQTLRFNPAPNQYKLSATDRRGSPYKFGG